VIAYLLKPELFRCEEMPVYVVTEGLCLGKTIADKHHHIFSSAHQAKVLVRKLLIPQTNALPPTSRYGQMKKV
jgi:inosine-uridine nucleoside N-ribohydrolase